MNITKLSNGNLQMEANSKERAFIRFLFTMRELNGYAQEAAFLAQFLRPTYQQTAPCSVGSLTDAPLITDGIDTWGFMDYQVESFLHTLADSQTVTWIKG